MSLMIIKRTATACLLFLLCVPFLAQSQTDNLILNDVDGHPLMKKESKDGNEILYVTKQGCEFWAASNRIEFAGGRDAFRSYIDSCYYSRPNYDYNELNHLISLCILIDSHLDVKETRIIRRTYDNSRYNIDNLFIDAVARTNGRWRIEKEDKKGLYIYIIQLRVY